MARSRGRAYSWRTVICAPQRATWGGTPLARGVGAVAEQPGLSFAVLLRQLRARALLTKEELAEAAGVSPRSVSDLERGINRTARKDTAVLLAGALGLAGPRGNCSSPSPGARHRPLSC